MGAGWYNFVMLVESVRVKNFKLFGEFAVEGLRPVTLLGGDNGCGKTTLLEAVLLCMHRKKSAYPISSALRGKQPQSGAFTELFHNLGIGGKVEVTCRGDGPEQFACATIDEDWEDAYVPPRIGDAGGAQAGTDQVKLLQVNYKEDGRKRGGMMFKIGREYPYVTYNTIGPAGQFRANDKFVHFRAEGGFGMFGMDAQHFAELDQNGRSEALRTLQIVAPHVRNIDLSEDKTDLLAEIAGVGVMSTASLGAGAGKALSLACVMHAKTGGLFLLDEVTVGWHHSHLVDLWRMIFRVCEERKHQVIATTHSDECITAFAETATLMKRENDAHYARLDRKGDNGRAQVLPADYSHETLIASQEMELDVR